MTYEDAFRSSLTYHFDEGGGFSPIAKKSSLKIYSEAPGKMSFGDISPGRPTFQIAYDQGDGQCPHIFKWENGKITGYWAKNGQIYSRPFSYIHLQKRRMQIEVDDPSQGFMIVPNKFIPITSQITPEFIDKWQGEVGNGKKKPFFKRLSDHIKYKSFVKEGRKRRIPLNSNEVYFGTEEEKY